jgi:DNA-binding winged helix-turn-helix (wHTH) protein
MVSLNHPISWILPGNPDAIMKTGGLKNGADQVAGFGKPSSSNVAFPFIKLYVLLRMPVQVETKGSVGRTFRLGPWLVEPMANRISQDGATIRLELKAMDLLVCLADRAGEVVMRQEIVDRVWASNFISDNTLTRAVAELRNALDDDAMNPSFIETIHRRGYRLIAPVEPVNPE